MVLADPFAVRGAYRGRQGEGRSGLGPHADQIVIGAGERDEFRGALSEAGRDRLDGLVEAGFRAWQRLDEELRRSRRLQPVERGTVSEADLAVFLTRSLGAVVESGWRRRSLEQTAGGACQVVEKSAEVYRLPDSSLGYLGSLGGIGLVGPDGSSAIQPVRLGLNHRLIAAALRERIGVDGRAPRGVGYVHVPAAGWERLSRGMQLPAGLSSGALVTAYCVRDLELGVHVRENSARFAVFLSSADAALQQRLDGETAAALLRLLRGGRPGHARTVPWDRERQFKAEVAQVEAVKAERSASAARVAVFPIAALWVIPVEDSEETGREQPSQFSEGSTQAPLEGTVLRGDTVQAGPQKGAMLKALSIRQPHAELILRGEKDVENRTWPTRHRGPLLIHAARTLDQDALSRFGIAEKDLTTGALVGIVDLVDCTEETRSRWHDEGYYGFYLQRPRRLNPVIPASGQRGIYEVPADLLATGKAFLTSVARRDAELKTVIQRANEALAAGRSSSLTQRLAKGEAMSPLLLAQEAEAGDALREAINACPTGRLDPLPADLAGRKLPFHSTSGLMRALVA